MALAICQNCGSILPSAAKLCQSCRASVSSFSATQLPSLSQATKPLTVEIRPDQAVLERLLLNRPNYPSASPARVQVSDFVSVRSNNEPRGDDGNVHNGVSEPAPIATLTLPAQAPPSPTETYNPADSWFPNPEEAVVSDQTGSLSSVEDYSQNKPTSFFEPLEKQQVLDDPSASVQPASPSVSPSAISSSHVYKLVDQPAEQLERSPISGNPPQPQDFFAGEKSVAPSISVVATPEPPPAPTAPLNYLTQPGQSIAENQPLPATAPPAALDFFASAPPLIAPPVSRQEAIQVTQPPLTNPFASAPQIAEVKSQQPPLMPNLEAQATGNVVMPGGFEKKESPDPTGAVPTEKVESMVTKEEDEEAQKEGFSYEAPKRRSFSGKQSDVSKKKSGSKSSDEDDDDDDVVAPKKTAQPGEIQLFGFSLSPKKIALIACVSCLLLFIAVQSIASVAGSFLTIVNQKFQAPGASLTGVWRFAMQANKRMAHGFIFMHQRGNQIFGSGKDDVGGTFRFGGSLKGASEIEFVKQYNRAGQDLGRPVTFRGDIDTKSKPLFAKGDFQSTYRSGYSWRAQIVNVTGIWEAELIEPRAEDQSIGAPPPPPVNKNDSSDGNFLTWAIHNGVGLAGVVVAIAVFCWQGAVWLFGPDGWRARADKAKYIPSQFKREHDKELKHLSQPLRAGSLPLGRRVEWAFWKFWEAKDLALTPDYRAANPHVLFLGGGGKGKSRLMSQMIAHDIESGDRAVVVIDSDGSTSDLIVNWIAGHERGKEFAKRTIIIDPTHLGGSLNYNPLEMPEDAELPNAAAAIVSGFKAIYTEPPGSQSQWTPQTAQILYSAALLLMITNRTLADLPSLLQDNDFRDILLEEADRKSKEKPDYRPLLDSWGNYKKMARTEQWINWVEPILNRIQRTLSDRRVRPILTNQKSDLSLKNLVNNKGVLILHIPKGELHEHANLLGSLVVTGLKQAALSVAIKGRSDNRPIALYVDEFDHFIEKETFNSLTSETKVFQIGFMGATKTLQDFPEDFRNQLVAKFGTWAVFAVPSKDGEMLGPQMFRVDGRKRKHETLTNFFNPINTSPQFEFVSDERTLNVDKILGQPEREFFCYRVGSVAGLFHLRSHTFNDIPAKDINHKLIDKMRKAGANPITASAGQDNAKV